MSLPFAEWLTRQRWYAGRGRTIASVRPAAVTPIDPDLDHMLLTVDYTDGGTECYQVFIGWNRYLRDEFSAIATIGSDGDRVGCDALYDESAARRILALIAADSARGNLRFRAEPGAEIDATVTARVIDGEQSNTSVVFDTTAILKVFRRVVGGVNPDPELSRELARQGSPYVARLLGSVESVDADGTPLSLAMVTAFARNSAEGWVMALASVRDLLDDRGPGTGDRHADEVGGDFAAEAYRLGEAVASVHAGLGDALGRVTAPPPVEHMRHRLDAAIGEVPSLAPYAAAARDVLAAATAPAALQRVHGDLHLGQVLRTPETWLLIDFEGEPGTPIEERRRVDSPLRDVAGMLRSFDYAGYQLLVNQPDDPRLADRAREWAGRNRDAFCAGYAAVAGIDPREHTALLRAYELDKVVYEAAYESRHRPGWLWIPLDAIDRLLGGVGFPEAAERA